MTVDDGVEEDGRKILIAEVARKTGFSLPFPFLQSSILNFHLHLPSLQPNPFPILIQFNFLFLYPYPRFLPKKINQQKYNFFSCLTSFSESLIAEHGPGITAMQSQIVCNGCRNMLLYPRGATNVCCALCNTISPVPPPGMDMSQLYCGGCRTLLMYTRGATSVRCSCCHTVNLAPVSNQVAHVPCANCRTTLMYPYGSPSVKCAVCHYITNINNISNGRVQVPANRPQGTTNYGTLPSTSTSMPQSQSQTVVVENPMSVDSSGKLVSNVVVGVTTDKK